MPIKAITIGQPGLVDVNPSIIYINTTDTYAEVTATGYLNLSRENGFAFNNQQIAEVYTTDSGAVFLQVSVTPTNVSLIESDSPGDVALPTITNHIIVSTNTTGALANLSGIAINDGSLQAGLSGTAGSLISYPATASKGNLELTAVANTGNTATVISNVAMGQASTVSIPDPANASGRFLVGATATPFVSGNFPQNSGTGGLMVDSGLSVSSINTAISNLSTVTTQLGQLQQISVTLNTAAVVASYATPQVLIAAVAGKVAIIHSANVYTASTGNTAFATGIAPIIQYSATVHGAGTIAVGSGLVTGDITAAASQVRTLGPAASTTYTGITNTPVCFSCTTAYTAGTGTSVTFTLVYELINATI